MKFFLFASALVLIGVAIRYWRSNQKPPPAAPEIERATHTAQPQRNELEEAADEFSLDVIVEPNRLEPIPIFSRSDPDTSYTVSLVEQTCTCADFLLRAQRPKNHFGRWCKHLMYALERDGAIKAANEWQVAIAQNGHGGPAFGYMIKLKSAGSVLMTGGNGSDWLNLFARKPRRGERIATASGSIAKYAWNVKEQRWAYGEGPPGAFELKKLLKTIERIKS